MSMPGQNDSGEVQSANVRRTRLATAPAKAVDDAASNGRSVGVILKDIVLFFAAPFVTIAYLALFPFIGVTMVLRARGQAGRNQKAGG